MSPLTNPYDAPLTSYNTRPFDTSQILNGDSQESEICMSKQNKARSSSLSNSSRVSRALKGKRVHMCEYPGCPKVFTRAEHRRRHELSHQSRRQYTCAHPGCGKAFHRPDYLTQHMSRHSSSSPTVGRYCAKSDTSSRPSSIQEMQSHTIHSSPMPFQLEPNGYSRTWGSMDSSMTYSQYSPAQSQRHSPVSVDGHSSPYSYTNERSSSPLSNDTYTDHSIQYPASGLPVELVTNIDQYLRSILRPEAFALSHQQMNPTMWTAETIEMDPILTKPESPELSLYSWPPAHGLSYDNIIATLCCI
ncbi:hypothetical protein PENANT_c027G11286 [Penicillium antarcticum]|uniref:C2H2 type master regulator of conidiophore development brlA n=1 Tax=Penicillium antarcticum TaxID=416450 RepID=A0A1V6PWV8_9EURO|nr:hypothetical protein PENANT_c027G11286 [Penicillium antarcticum]